MNHDSANCRVSLRCLQQFGNNFPKFLIRYSPEANVRILFQFNRLKGRENNLLYPLCIPPFIFYAV